MDQRTRLDPAVGVLIAGVVAFCGADRLDLAGGQAPVTVTPALLFYAGALVVVAVVGIKLRGRLALGRDALSGLAVVLALSAIALISVMVAGMPAQPLRRWALLTVTVAGVWGALLLARLKNLEHWLRLGAWVGLCLACLLSVVQYLNWSPAQAGVAHWWGPIYVTSPTYGPIAPRPSGISLDPNRGALVSAVLLFVIAVDPWTRIRRRPRLVWTAVIISAACALPTLSRSGLLVWGVVVIMALRGLIREQGPLRVLVPVGSLVLLGAAAVVAALTLSHTNLIVLLQERLSFSSSDSGGQHFELLSMAMTVLNEEPLRWLTGIGFGNSPAFVGEFFQGRDVANFHSFFVTFLVEMGLPGLLCALVLAGYPLLRPGRRILAAALFAFGLIYQAHLDGVFWLAVGLLWLSPDAGGSEHVVPTKSGQADPPAVSEVNAQRLSAPARQDSTVTMSVEKNPVDAETDRR